VPSAVCVYAWVYTGALLPLFTVRSDALFERVVWAYVLVFAVCSVSFVLFPVSATALRPVLPPLADPGFTDWSIRLLYALDPPLNLFPSLHVAFATCAATASWKAQKSQGLFVFPWVMAISASTCLTKQHYAIDVIAGIVVGVGVFTACTRSLPGGSNPGDTTAAAAKALWLPVIIHLAFLLSFYSFYAAFGMRVSLLD
jgi:membrane-associated phospholipid phosphatase